MSLTLLCMYCTYVQYNGLAKTIYVKSSTFLSGIYVCIYFIAKYPVSILEYIILVYSKGHGLVGLGT